MKHVAKSLYPQWSAIPHVKCPQSNQEIRYVKRVGYGITANNFELKMGKCLVEVQEDEYDWYLIKKNFWKKK